MTTDIIILLMLGLPALVGVMYGFLNILFSLIAWILALGIATRFSGAFSHLFESYIQTPMIRGILAFIGLFIISLLLFSLLGYIVVRLLGRTGLTAADRIFGFFFGLGLGGAIVMLAVFLAGFTAVTEDSWWQRSVLLEPFERTAVWARRFLPDNVVEYHRYGGEQPPVETS